MTQIESRAISDLNTAPRAPPHPVASLRVISLPEGVDYMEVVQSATAPLVVGHRSRLDEKGAHFEIRDVHSRARGWCLEAPADGVRAIWARDSTTSLAMPPPMPITQVQTLSDLRLSKVCKVINVLLEVLDIDDEVRAELLALME